MHTLVIVFVRKVILEVNVRNYVQVIVLDKIVPKRVVVLMKVNVIMFPVNVNVLRVGPGHYAVNYALTVNTVLNVNKSAAAKMMENVMH